MKGRNSITKHPVNNKTGTLNKLEENHRDDVLQIAESKFERRLSEETSKLREDMTVMREELRVEIAETRAEIIKWMFIFILGQFWAIIGTLFVFFK